MSPRHAAGFLLLPQSFEQGSGEISLAKAASDCHDCLALVFRLGSDSGSTANVSAGADAAEDAFFMGQPARPFIRLFVGDQFDAVQKRCIEVLGDESRPDSL